MDEEEKLQQIWRQKDIPVIFRANKQVPLQIRLPYNSGNRAWLKCTKRKTEPEWVTDKKFWRLPKSRLNELVGNDFEAIWQALHHTTS